MKKTIISSCSAMVLTSLLMVSGGALFSSSAMAAKECKSNFEAEFATGTKKAGKNRAKRRWERKVTNKFGSKWANWGNAKNRSLTCEWDSEGNTIFNPNDCTARAKPCKG